MRDRHRHRARVAVELGALKPQWEAYCRRTGVSTSEAIRSLVSQSLNALPVIPAVTTTTGLIDTDAPHRRLEIRLTAGEYAALHDLADAVGFSVNRWTVALIRAQLTATPQFGDAELAALAASNTRLAAIGRNLNQIARALNTHELVEPYRFKLLEILKTEIDEHLDTVTDVIRANLDRWGRG